MTTLVIALHDLKLAFRDRAAIFWIFIGPLLFATFFGLLFRPSPTRSTVVDLIHDDQDAGVARMLGALLEQDGLRTRRAEQPGEGWAVEIPPGTATELGAGRPVRLLLRSIEDEETNAERRLSFRLQKALWTLYLQAGAPDLAQDADPAAFLARIERGRVLVVRDGDPGIQRRVMTSGFQRSVPSYLVMFVFLNLLVAGAGIAEERARGQMRRLFIAPIARWQIIAGKLLGRVTIGWIQTAWLLAFGVLVLKVRWADHPWVFFGFLTVFALGSAALGVLLGTLFRDPDKCRTTAVWTGVLLAPLGGLWWPLEIVGPTMRQIGRFVPTGWAMESVNAMLAFGAGAGEVAPYALAFLGLAIVCVLLAARRLKP